MLSISLPRDRASCASCVHSTLIAFRIFSSGECAKAHVCALRNAIGGSSPSAPFVSAKQLAQQPRKDKRQDLCCEGGSVQVFTGVRCVRSDQEHLRHNILASALQGVWKSSCGQFATCLASLLSPHFIMYASLRGRFSNSCSSLA